MTDKLASGMSPKQENEGRYISLVGEYVRVVMSHGTSLWGVLKNTDYEKTIIQPYLNIIFDAKEQKKVLYAKLEDRPAIFDTRNIGGISYLGKEAFDKHLEDLLKE